MILLGWQVVQQWVLLMVETAGCVVDSSGGRLCC